MTAMTAVHAARAAQAAQVKPPVEYTHDAIKAGIAYEAANGPSHVRIKALGMMARIMGLFDIGKQLAKQAVETLSPEARRFRDACAALKGVDLRDLSMFKTAKPDDDDEDEEEGTNDEDEPP